MKHIKKIFKLYFFAALMLTACKKDNFKNTGLHVANFNGTVLDYLKVKPLYFDSLIKVIKLAGMETAFQSEEITFFAPADSSINRTISLLNESLDALGKPRVYKLEQIKPEVWKQYLSLYLFKGKKSMNDYPQIDPSNLASYPGQIYASYDGGIMNIGVDYQDAGGVRYAGYRQLRISYIPSPSAPLDYGTWLTAVIASVNIAPTNGYVHVLNYSDHYFGFTPTNFIEVAISKGIN